MTEKALLTKRLNSLNKAHEEWMNSKGYDTTEKDYQSEFAQASFKKIIGFIQLGRGDFTAKQIAVSCQMFEAKRVVREWTNSNILMETGAAVVHTYESGRTRSVKTYRFTHLGIEILERLERVAL